MAAAAVASTRGAAIGATRTGGGLTHGATGMATGTLQTAASMPSLLPNSTVAPHGLHAAKTRYLKCVDHTVSDASVLSFLFPAKSQNPNSTGRLEIFARYGPADEDGYLRGGAGGSHVHTDSEINEMIKVECREALFKVYGKPRSDSEVIIDSLMPVAMMERYTEDDVRRLLRKVPRDEYGRMNFYELQRVVHESQVKRLKAICKRLEGGKPINQPKERPQKVPFQSKSAAALMEVTVTEPVPDARKPVGEFKLTKKKKFGTVMEEIVAAGKLQHSYCTLVAPLEQQSLGQQLSANVVLMRRPGGVDDRWDRYCALRRTGRSSYVGSRNEGRFNPSADDGLSNKHPGVSSLLAAGAAGSSAAMQLAA